MTYPEFLQLTRAENTPDLTQLRPELQVLFHSKRNDWEGAHDIAQDLPDPHGAWLHAHLHREEGDLGNAAYWYHRAGQPTPKASCSLAEEWETLAQHFCDNEKSNSKDQLIIKS